MCPSGRAFRWFWAVLLACAVGSSAFGQQHERKRLERVEILQLEAKWREAQLAEDIPAMDRLLSDEYLGITAAGQVVTKLQQLDRMRTRRLAISRLDMSDTKMKISGNLAVVTSLGQLDGSADGAPLHGAFRFTRVYHRIGRGEWKITNFEATRVSGGGAELRHPARGTPQANFAEPHGPGSSSR